MATSKESNPQSMSQYALERQRDNRNYLIRTALLYTLPILVAYPFFFYRLSLFPGSLYMSLFQYFLVVTAIPTLACFRIYKGKIAQKEKDIILWNQMDLKRRDNLSALFDTYMELDKNSLPCTEPIISGTREEGPWKAQQFKKAPEKIRIEYLLSGIKFSDARNYAGLGFGIIVEKGRSQGGTSPEKASHNIKNQLFLQNSKSEINALMPGPGANRQWLSGMKRALIGASGIPKGCHTHDLLQGLAFEKMIPKDGRFSQLEDQVAAQASAPDEFKLPITVWGYRLEYNIFLATQMAIGDQPPVPLYYTGFFAAFTEELRKLGMSAQVSLKKQKAPPQEANAPADG